MKNKIISLLLAVLTIFTVFVLPASADGEKFIEATTAATANSYSDVTEKLVEEFDKGYTFLYAQNEKFQLFCNKYTGEIYLRDRTSGQYLTSNPLSVGDNNKADKLSQVWLTYRSITSESASETYNSFTMAAERGQIAVSKIENGIRVEYTMGDATSRFIAPQAILAEDFTNSIIIPLQQSILNFFENLTSNFDSFVNASDANYQLLTYEGELGDEEAFSKYLKTNIGIYGSAKKNVTSQFRRDYDAAYKQLTADLKSSDPAVVAEAELKAEKMLAQIKQILPSATDLPSKSTSLGSYISKSFENFNNLLAYYPSTSIIDLSSIIDDPEKAELIEQYKKTYPILQNDPDPETGYPKIRVIQASTDSDAVLISTYKNVQSFITKSVPSYTLDQLLEQEDKIGFSAIVFENPLFRCAIEYTLDETGMTVDIPASSIIFDESKYEITDLSFLRYFNAGSTKQDGYVFYPDGSGALIFNSQMSSSAVLKQPVYSYDYAYSSLRISGTGDSVNSSQSVRLPVYGSVNADSNGNYVGFLGIITEGDSMAYLNTSMMANSYVGIYPSYIYRPRDNYSTSRLSSSVAISSDFKYTGYYSEKIIMLTDSTLNPDGYVSSYVGMAAAYRDYLFGNGTLTSVDTEAIQSTLPLYIETYASTETVESILSFPVEVDKALTTFKDIEKMYDYLSSEEIGIKNVKFRLMGYYNDGYKGYYPNRIKWMKVAGGKKGFKKLMNYVSEHSEDGLEVFTDVDLLYDYISGKIGGISRKKTGARSMDDRYIRKAIYSTIYRTSSSNRGVLVSASKLAGLFKKFDKKFSKFKATAISFSNLATDLSSDFNEDNCFTREEAKSYVTGVFETASEKYSVLSTGGNLYALPYVDYLLDAPVDGSHYNFVSRTVPFFGMVMHGAFQYAGSIFNEAGNPEYEILRAIESGAGMYFVLVYDNTDLMKEDVDLIKHYSANYTYWQEDLVGYYNILDYAIGDLQDWTIVDHQFLNGERKVKTSEHNADLATLEKEYLNLLEDEIKVELEKRNGLLRRFYEIGYADASAKDALYESLVIDILDDKFTSEAKQAIEDTMTADSSLSAVEALKKLVTDGVYSLTAGQKVGVTVDYDAIIANAETSLDSAVTDDFKTKVTEFKAKYDVSSTVMAFTLTGVSNYDSKTSYSFFTDSAADDSNYKTTDYTINDGSVVVVTYSNGTDTVRLLLNFGIFTVTVNYGGQKYVLDKYDFVRLDARADGKTDPRNQ